MVYEYGYYQWLGEADNTTMAASRALLDLAGQRGWKAELVQLEPFDQLFDGDYLKPENATPEQAGALQTLIDSELLLFVVPTYYKSMPGALKNFFDLARSADIYARKRIAVVASNHKHQDYGARHAMETVMGILVFFNIPAVVIPEILIMHPGAIDEGTARRWLRQLDNYPKFE